MWRCERKSRGTERHSKSQRARILVVDSDPNTRRLLATRLIALAQEKIMTESFVQESLGGEAASAPAFDEAREELSRQYLTDNLLESKGNVTESARLAKRNRTDFYRLLTRYRLQAEDFKSQKSLPAKD